MVDKIFRGLQAGAFLFVFIPSASGAFSQGNGFVTAVMYGAFLGVIALVVVSMGLNFIRNVVGI